MPVSPAPTAVWLHPPHDNLSDNSWSKVIDTLNTVANTLKSDTLQNGAEYALASTNDPLPVELNSFSASVMKEGIKLNWRTETEVKNYGFNIERSEAGGQNSEWEIIGFGPGN